MFNKIASTFLIKIAVAFINLAIVVILSQLIGAVGKGEASLILTSIAMLLLFTNIVGGPALIYFVPRHNTFFLFIASNLWSLIICLIAYFVFKNTQFIPSEFVLPIVLLSFINSLLTTNTTILLGKEKIQQSNFILFVQAFVNIVVLYLFIIHFYQNNVYAYINSLYFAFTICFLISFFMVFKYLKIVDYTNSTGILKELFKLGFLNQLGHFLKFASFRYIYFIIAKYAGESALGIFSNGNSVTEAVLLITNSYITVIHPRISNSTDLNYSRQLTIKYTKHSILMCSLAFGILILFPESFWLWLFGKDFAGLSNIILVLTPGIFLYNIALILGHYFSGIGRPQINTIANFTGLLTTTILILLVIPNFNLIDISIISTFSYLTTTIVIIVFFMNESKTKLRELAPSINDLKDLKKDILLLFKN